MCVFVYFLLTVFVLIWAELPGTNGWMDGWMDKKKFSFRRVESETIGSRPGRDLL